jgi:hypothetical protein
MKCKQEQLPTARCDNSAISVTTVNPVAAVHERQGQCGTCRHFLSPTVAFRTNWADYFGVNNRVCGDKGRKQKWIGETECASQQAKSKVQG